MQKNFTKEEEQQVCALFIALHLLLQHTSDEYRYDKGAEIIATLCSRLGLDIEMFRKTASNILQ